MRNRKYNSDEFSYREEKTLLLRPCTEFTPITLRDTDLKLKISIPIFLIFTDSRSVNYTVTGLVWLTRCCGENK